MASEFSRRNFLMTAAGASLLPGASLVPGILKAQQPPAIGVPVSPYPGRSTVALLKGNNRRKLIYETLLAIDEQIKPQLARKKSVVIKPNNVSTEIQLAATHADTLRGILDYLAPRFKGPIYIAESSAGETMRGFDNFGYTKVPADFKSRTVKLIDLNEEAKYEMIPLIDYNLHLSPVRLAKRLLDPDAFVFCSGMLKTHNTVVATLSVKNMVLGAPLHQAPKETPRWNDKRKYHVGLRQTHYNMLLTAQKMKPFWGVTLLDGFEGMEGNGPSSGTPVDHRIAIASTDYIAADRVGVEAMGINPNWPGYLNFCHQVGLGQYDLSKIDIRGEKLASVVKKYQMHKDVERELQWMGPMNELPPRLG